MAYNGEIKNYIYLVCTAHSGSTLLAFLLGSHPQIATVGELAGRTDYDEYKCSCGELMTECSFWKCVRKNLFRKHVKLDMSNFDIFIDNRRKYNKLDRIYDHYYKWKAIEKIKETIFEVDKKRKEWIAQTIERNVLIAEAITACADKECFLDTTKDLYRLKHLLIRLGDRVKVIYMTRDGQGVMNSLMKREKLSPKKAIYTWLWSNNTIFRMQKNYCSEGQIYQLKYENLCKNTGKELDRLYDFLDLKKVKYEEITNKKEYHIIGNFMRKKFNGKIRLDERWRDELGSEEKKLFNRIGKNKNTELGYLE